MFVNAPVPAIIPLKLPPPVTAKPALVIVPPSPVSVVTVIALPFWSKMPPLTVNAFPGNAPAELSFNVPLLTVVPPL